MQDALSTPIGRRTTLRGIVTVAGIAVALPTLTSLGGCKQVPADIADKTELLSAVADRVIPTTDTPGAIEADVPAYIAAVFASHFTMEQQNEFADGLNMFDKMAVAEGANSFAQASAETQDKILTGLDNGGGDMPAHAIWRSVREMTIFGYYTSQMATQELSFEEIPGRYIGCTPLEEVGRAWLDRGV